MRLIDKLKRYFRYRATVFDAVAQLEAYVDRKVIYRQQADRLTECALHCKEPGVSSQRYCDHDVTVTLTTYGRRLRDVYLPIESIMQGSMLPNRIVLWLSEEYRNSQLPMALQNQMKRGLEVRYCKDIRSYTKLIPALKCFPEDCLVTIDDDVIYDFDMLEQLVASYRNHPADIHANRVHRLTADSNGVLKSYRYWEWRIENTDEVTPRNFLTGVGGVLYPPHVFNEEVMNEKVFLDICKYADDVWFYCMALYNGKRVRKVATRSADGEDYMENEEVQAEGLRQQNADTVVCRNDEQLLRVLRQYQIEIPYKLPQ